MSRDTLLLRTNAQLLAYVDVFLDDFIGLSQGLTQWQRHVRRTLLCDLDKVFRSLDKLNPPKSKEVLLLKKLDVGDFSWSTCQMILGWVLDIVNIPNSGGHRTLRWDWLKL